MSDTIYQLIEKYSKVKLPIQSGKELPKVETDFELYEDRCEEWGNHYRNNSGPLNVNWKRKWSDEERQHLSNINKERNINFVSLGATEAARLVNTGKKQSVDHITKRTKNQYKEIEIEGILYKSGKEASKELGYSPGAISAWAKKNGSRYGITIPKGSNQYTYGKNRS